MSDVVYPRNQLTDEIERLRQARLNARMGHMESAVTGQAQPSVRSASVGVPSAPPLTPEEEAERNRLARLHGLLPEGPEPEVPVQREEARPLAVPLTPLPVERMTAREFIGRDRSLPNWTAVQGIDLIRNKIYIDGMEFNLPEGDAYEFRRYCVELVRDDIMEKLTAAVNLFAPGSEVRKDGATTPLQDVQGNETGDVQPLRADQGTAADSGVSEVQKPKKAASPQVAPERILPGTEAPEHPQVVGEVKPTLGTRAPEPGDTV